MVDKVWQLQDAKNKFSEVVDEAISSGPQLVTRRGVDAAVVISAEDYQKMIQSKRSIFDWLQECPGDDLCELLDNRDKEAVRDFELS